MGEAAPTVSELVPQAIELKAQGLSWKEVAGRLKVNPDTLRARAFEYRRAQLEESTCQEPVSTPSSRRLENLRRAGWERWNTTRRAFAAQET